MMTETAARLLETFDSLPPEEQHAVVAEMLRRSGELPESILTDNELTGLADGLFQALDLEDSNGGESGAR